MADEMKTIAQENTKISEDLSAPIVFVDGFQGLAIGRGPVGGYAKLTLFQDIQLLEASPVGVAQFVRKPAIRLVMTPETLVNLHAWLGENIKPLIEQMVGNDPKSEKK